MDLHSKYMLQGQLVCILRAQYGKSSKGYRCENEISVQNLPEPLKKKGEGN